MAPELENWQKLFAQYGYTVKVEGISVPAPLPKQNVLIFSPVEVTGAQLARLYGMLALKFTDSKLGISIRVGEIEDVLGSRTSSVSFVKAGAFELYGELCRTDHDSSMTIRQKFLHDIYMWHHYGVEYANLFPDGFFHRCEGSPVGGRRCIAVNFDPHDIKICVELS
jgi:hypothetical protein